MKNLLVFATLLEAEPSIVALNAQVISPNIYAYEKGYLVITGMGMVAAERAVIDTLATFSIETIWNFGVAGKLSAGKVGEVYSVQKIGRFPGKEEIHLPEEGVSLISSETPIHDQALSKRLSEKWQLVDMEGYGIAQAAAMYNKPLFMRKFVSDFASEGGAELIKKNIASLAKQISAMVETL